jgi:hypothetical protein
VFSLLWEKKLLVWGKDGEKEESQSYPEWGKVFKYQILKLPISSSVLPLHQREVIFPTLNFWAIW